jgi:hypothetical protein
VRHDEDAISTIRSLNNIILNDDDDDDDILLYYRVKITKTHDDVLLSILSILNIKTTKVLHMYSYYGLGIR